MDNESITAKTLPGHDPEARVNGAGPHDPFDPDAPDTPERHAGELGHRVVALEEHVSSLRTVAVVLSLAVLMGALLGTLLVARARSRA